MTEKLGLWANEYAQGRIEQVKQQRIANLIAFAALENAWASRRKWAMNRAYAELGGE